MAGFPRARILRGASGSGRMCRIMPTPEQGRRPGLRALQEAHELLRELAADLSAVIDDLGAAGGNVRFDALALAASEFRDGLLRHLAFEECDGYLKPVTLRNPARGEEVRRLREEHDRMRAAVDRLYEDAIAFAKGEPREFGAFAAGVHGLLAEISAHERKEEALLREAASE